MAKVPKTYDDETVYRVKLMRPVRYRNVPLAALPVHEMTGAAVKEIIEAETADVIDSAKPR